MHRRNHPFPTQEDKTREQLQEFFKQHAENGDKFLTQADLEKAFKDLHSRFPHFRARRAMAKADADGDKRINQQEIEALVDYTMRFQDPFKTKSVPYTKQQSQEFFKQYDKDEDKFLNKAEPKKAFDDLHSRNAGFRAMSEAVEDGDDHISQQEMGALPQIRPLKNMSRSRRNPKQEHKTTSVRDTDQKSQVKERDRDKFLSEEADIKHSRDHGGVGFRRAKTKVVEDGDDHFSQREMGALPQSPPLKNMSRWNSNQEHKSVRDTDKKLQEGIIAALTCSCFQSKESNGQS